MANTRQQKRRMDKNNKDSLYINDDAAADVADVSLGAQLSRIASSHPETEAVVYACHDEVANVRWTFATLDAKAERLAMALLGYGYAPGDNVAIWAPNNPEWILLEYAFAKAGLTIVALNPLYKEDELVYALTASQVKGIFYADSAQADDKAALIERVRQRVPSLHSAHSFHEGIAAISRYYSDDRALPDVDAQQLLMIQYTSGTTGMPKAAQLSHRGVATTARNTYRTWGFAAGDRVCHGFPQYHVGGSGNSTPGSALVAATTLPLYIFKAERTLDILEQESCSGFIGVPTMLTAMLEHPTFARRNFTTLRTIVIGGAVVPAPLIRRCEDAFGVSVINGYGQTETSGVVSSTLADDSAQRKASTSGRAMPGISLKVCDRNGDVVPLGSSGELCYRGPGCMLGYRDAKANAAAFDADGWLRTGDMAVMDAEGYVQITGRTKELIIRGGENLSPSEIECYLLEHPDVLEAAVLGLPDEKYGEEVCAVLRLRDGADRDAEAIRGWCRDKLSRWKVPRYIEFTTQYPKTPSGKIQKFALKAQLLKQMRSKVT